MRTVPLERRAFDADDVPELFAHGKAFVMSGAPLARPLVDRWSFEHLGNAFDGSERLQVHYVPAATSETADDRPPKFARIYGEGLGAGGVRLMSFREFAQATGTSCACRFYLAAPLVRNAHTMQEVDDDELTIEPCCGGNVLHELMTGVDWTWLVHNVQELCPEGSPFDMAQLWAGCSMGATPLHFDALSNLLAQLAGRKRVVLFPPSQSFLLYPYAVGHPCDNFSMVDVSDPDLERFPALRHACGYEAVLEPGDVLFIPRYWWHYVEQLPSADGGPEDNLSLNFWFGLKGTGSFKRELHATSKQLPDDEAVAAAARAAAIHADKEGPVDSEPEVEWGDGEAGATRALLAARHTEGCSAELLGSGTAAGRFLTQLARGEDASWHDSATKRHADRTRAGLMALLGSAERASALLRAMTRDGRLYPGLAPSIGPHVVNSEKGQLSSEDAYKKALESRRPAARRAVSAN